MTTTRATIRHLAIAGLLALFAPGPGCGDDAAPLADLGGEQGVAQDGPPAQDYGGRNDAPVGQDGPAKADGPAKTDSSAKCISTDPKGCGGDITKWCDFGTCKACPAGTFNCNGTDSCECSGGCSGTTCTGTKACDYSDPDVCGKDTSKWCYQSKCISCSSGFYNCDNTKGCECSGGCNGTKCQ